jgi:transposase InsO family protein
MKAVADTLGIARSNLTERLAKPARPRGPFRKPGDLPLLVLIRSIVDARPTYSYRQVTALVNRKLRGDGKPAVNAKRVLRIMRTNGLILAPHTAQRRGRSHDGVVVALRSNVRWCSDHLELHCRDGAVVRVLFAVDACDHEVIAWSATTGGVSGEMVRDLMVAQRPNGGLGRRAPRTRSSGCRTTATPTSLARPPRSPRHSACIPPSRPCARRRATGSRRRS